MVSSTQLILVFATCLASVSADCNATFLGQGGFDVCFYGKSQGVGSLIATAANTAWAMQRAFALGGCYCETACTPTQIVCESPATVATTYLALAGIPNGDILAWVTQFAYQLENYNFYCFCADQAPADVCDRPADPCKCCEGGCC